MYRYIFMDEYSGKRAVNGIVVPRRGSGLVLRDNANGRDTNGPFCSRAGCGGRLSTQRAAQNGCLEKTKSSRPLIRSSSSGKEIIGSSSRTCSSINRGRKSVTENQNKLSLKSETDSSETSSVLGEPDVSELTSPPGKIQRGSELVGPSSTRAVEVGSSSVSRKNLHHSTGLRNQDTVGASPASMGSKHSAQAMSAGASRYGIRSLRCNPISDVIPSGSSSSDSSLSKRKETVRRRNTEGESSFSTRGKKINGSSLEGRNSSSSHGISISDSRRARNLPANRDSCAASVRTRRSVNDHTRGRLSNQGNGNNLSPNEPSLAVPQMLQPDMPFDLNGRSSAHHFSAETSLSRATSYPRPGSHSERLRRVMPANLSEAGRTHSLTNQDSNQRYNIDGIAEVLLALDRIEQDEELTYEQILVLETNLFLNGLYVYDQHRDMRLDIDNMSYEELLALEERMGNVSTALPEEALSECLKRTIYESAPPEGEAVSCNGDNGDVKCSICQEEYLLGDELGRLQCDHRYHMVCVQQWLRFKNWCPICKASAAPSSSSLQS